MIDLIRKRHPAPGWVVIEEVGNATGAQQSRYADAVAYGIWPSHGYAVHGFELKRSREDLKKELIDPRKADAIGKFCDYWWLVLSDKKLMDGFAIPETWGVLYKHGQVLKVGKKAPKRDATPISRGFVAAVIRRVVEGYVPKSVHEEYKKNAKEAARAEIERERTDRREDNEHQLRELRKAVERFQEVSGVSIVNRYLNGQRECDMYPLPNWQLEGIAEAVAIVVKARETAHERYRRHDTSVVALVDDQIREVKRRIENAQWMIQTQNGILTQIEHIRAEAVALECQTSGLTNPDGSPSPVAGTADDPRSGGDSGDAGAHEQDAGVQLRDQRAEVPHGEQAPSDPG